MIAVDIRSGSQIDRLVKKNEPGQGRCQNSQIALGFRTIALLVLHTIKIEKS